METIQSLWNSGGKLMQFLSSLNNPLIVIGLCIVGLMLGRGGKKFPLLFGVGLIIAGLISEKIPLDKMPNYLTSNLTSYLIFLGVFYLIGLVTSKQ
jgi:hypothetical protein